MSHTHAEGHVEERAPLRIKWYRCPVPREELSKLNKRNDLLAWGQTLGFLAVLATNFALALYSAFHWPWWATVLLTFWHGMWWPFLINAHHELVHDSVFKTKSLNRFWLLVFTFMGWQNHHWFWQSHTEHHKYTLHEPDDLEVTLPVKITLMGFLMSGFFDPRWFYHHFKGQIKRAVFGNYNPKNERWTEHLFPPEEVEGRRKLVSWSRVLLVGHGLTIAGFSVLAWYTWTWQWLMVPVLFSFTPSYGKWLHFLCNESQHSGLVNFTPDYRLCCRTIYLNPFVQFMYWHMNYHTEHHMYAAVPCYNLPRLHRVIKADMPPCPNGLWATWRGIAEILKRQKTDPTYQFKAAVPTPGRAEA